MDCMNRPDLVESSEEPAGWQAELTSAVQAGAPGAFAKFYEAYAQRLYKTIVAITRNHQDAEDALQETFLRAHLRLDTFEGRSSIYSWLTRIAINSALMILRQRRTRPETPFDPHLDAWANAVPFEVRDSAPDPERICDLRQRKAKVLSAISRLERQLQTPIRMQALGSSLKEISRALNISESAVKARLHRARRRLSTRRVLQSFGTAAPKSQPQRDYVANSHLDLRSFISSVRP